MEKFVFLFGDLNINFYLCNCIREEISVLPTENLEIYRRITNT